MAPKQRAPDRSKLKVLGEGSFGCVVSHPLECSGKEIFVSSKKDPTKKQVSKLFYEKQKYQAEVKLGRLVKKIDPTEERIIVPIKGCEVSRKTLYKPANANAISKCENLASLTSTGSSKPSHLYESELPLQSIWQLTMPYAGKEVDKVIQRYKHHITTRSFMKMMTPLFEAVVMLANRRMVHQDIKIGNVLIHDKKAILIDFSLMLPFEEIYQEKNYNRLKRRYRPFPPEYYMASIIIKHKADFKRMKPAEIKSSIAERYKNHLENIQSYFFPYYSTSELFELSNYGSLMITALSNYKKFVDFADKIDIFSVGTLLADVHDLLADPLSNTEYVSLMRGILHPDPRQRMSAEEALELCKKIAGS